MRVRSAAPDWRSGGGGGGGGAPFVYPAHSADDRRPRVEGVYHVTIELPPPTTAGPVVLLPVLLGA